MDLLIPDTECVEAVADLWVDLAAGQRAHGSHILAEANRAAIEESLVRHAVAEDLLIARQDDDLAGFVMFTVEEGTYEQAVVRGLIENLYVVPAHRGDGIGSELLRAAERTLTARGAEVVSLDVMADNEAARRFYARHGYDPHRLQLEKPTESDTL